jgi:hypothetical protein
LYNILIGIGITVTVVRLIKICLAETYSWVSVGKHMYNMLRIKIGIKQDALLPLFFNFALEYSIRRVQVNQVGLKLNSTHQLLLYAGDINVWNRSIHTVKKITENSCSVVSRLK